MRSGRTDEQKQALYARIAELSARYGGTDPRNVFITIHENQFADWSFGSGVAQYLDR
jgi:phenylpyruvate tautomerase PptA (4-oxalocrotonate tautomerase family)